MTMPFVSAICPTYLRPRMVDNIIACWQQQKYPSERCELVILDDSGNMPDFQFSRYDNDNNVVPPFRLIGESVRYPSLPKKFNRLLELIDPRTEIVVVMEDDEVYLPHHISSYANGMENCLAAKPTWVYTTYGCEFGKVAKEVAAGRFHASLGMRVELLNQIGGWVDTDRADFDQKMIRKALEAANGAVYDQTDTDPSYIFRWQYTGHPHGQHFMKSPEDTDWYARAEGRGDITDRREIGVSPRMDAETVLLMENYSLV